MTLGNSIIVSCPTCEGKKELMQINSGNTFGEKFWSDCKSEAPMLPKLSPIQKCPHCNHYYLLSRVKIEDGSNYSMECGWPTFHEMLEALEESKNWGLTKKEYSQIHLQTLWSFNDMERYGNKVPEEIRSKVKPIIEKLIPTIDDLLFKAELYREMEMYNHCLDTLKSYSSQKEYNKQIADIIASYAEKKDCKVFNIY